MNRKKISTIEEKMYPGITRVSDKLKPCPFCSGDHIEIFSQDFGSGSNIMVGWKVRCIQCDASVWEISKYFIGAGLKWNKRNGKTDMDMMP